MDELAKYNQGRWQELVDAGIEWSRPNKNLDAKQALALLEEWSHIDRLGLSDLAGKDVLCLATGGGQQSVSFALLGANVSVIDITEGQLEKDRAMALHYGHDVRVEQGDMRDLSVFEDESFDLIYQAYSINFVPDPVPVISEAARVLRPNGAYYLQFGNPLWNMEETDWTEKGYPIRQPYVQGQQSTPEDLPWDIPQDDGTTVQVQGPKDFTHTLGTLVNALGSNGLNIFAMWEGPAGDPNAEPGTWDHMKTYIPIWPAFWSRKL